MTDLTDVVQIGREAEAMLTIGQPVPTSDSSSRIPIAITSPGLTASGWADLEDWNGGARALIDYFSDLAELWRGWPDAKEWRDAGATCGLSATHDGKGLVVVRVQLSSLSYDSPGHWKTVVDVPVEPGVLGEIANQLRRLLT